jgi:hypothetical protein
LADMYWALALGDEPELRTMAPIGGEPRAMISRSVRSMTP